MNLHNLRKPVFGADGMALGHRATEWGTQHLCNWLPPWMDECIIFHVLSVSDQWSFRKTRTMGTLTSVSVWGYYTPKKLWNSTVYATSCNPVHVFVGKWFVHNAFLNTLTMGTLFPCVPAAFPQWNGIPLPLLKWPLCLTMRTVCSWYRNNLKCGTRSVTTILNWF